MQKALKSREIHVWFARSDLSDAAMARLSALLDEEERRRAAQFRFDDDRRRSVVARGMLRLLLARYLEREARELRFTYNATAKPALADHALDFNVSHSAEWVAIAIARDRLVGIDIERERPMPDLLDLVESYFAPIEAAAVRDAPPNETIARFFAIWTAKGVSH